MSVLEAHRSKSKVCENELQTIFYQSPERFQSLRKLIEAVKKYNPKEKALAFYEQDRASQVRTAYEFLARFIRTKMYDVSVEEIPIELNYMVNFEIPGSVSALMVRPIIHVLATDEQRRKWLPLFDSGRVFGCYAQTELGHGSDVQGLETEAIYDEERKEFVVNSPTVSSYKWWPGEITNLSSVAVVFAKTMVRGKRVGVLPFILWIRDPKTHRPMPGVEIGDIGPKFGYFAKENGFLKFTNVRIPLENMLSRFSAIDSEGRLVSRGNPKIIYASMMKSRTALLEYASAALIRCTAIAIRYSMVRKQFKDEQKHEIPVLSYQLQQHRLFPLLAKSYAMRCSFAKILEVINECNREIENGNFSHLQEAHVILSGSKAWYTWWCSNGLWVTMNCCGGHGYSKYSGITHLMETTMPNTILEGENTMLSLQVGAFLLKCMKRVHEGKLDKVTGYCQYLKDVDGLLAFNADFKEDVTDCQKMKRLWQKAVLAKLAQIGEAMVGDQTGKSPKDQISSSQGIRVFESAKLHTILFTFDYFLQYIDNNVKCAETKKALLNLARLFIAEQTAENAQILAGLDVISADQLKAVARTVEPLLEAIFPDCLKLAEVIMFDEDLNYSLIADSNEKPYENLYNTAKNIGILNKVDMVQPYLDIVRAASELKYPQVPKL